MKIASITLGLFVLFISCSNDRLDNEVISYLKEKYEIDWDKIESISVEEMPIYYDKDNLPQIRKLDLQFLEQKTGYQFSKAILRTGYMEYPELQMIIAVSKVGTIKIKELISPTFTDVSQDFLKIFQELKINSDEERKKLVIDISELFREITYEGEIKNINKEHENFMSELWHGRLKWRILKFVFEKDKLVELIIMNPKSSFTKIENE